MKQASSKEKRHPGMGARIRLAMTGRNKRQIAKAVGCDYATLHYWIRGESAPGSRLLGRLAKECSVSTDWLVGLTDDPEPNWTNP